MNKLKGCSHALVSTRKSDSPIIYLKVPADNYIYKYVGKKLEEINVYEDEPVDSFEITRESLYYFNLRKINGSFISYKIKSGKIIGENFESAKGVLI